MPNFLSSQVNDLCVGSGGRFIYVSGHNLDVVQEPRMVVTISSQLANQRRGRRMVPKHSGCPENRHCSVREVCVHVSGRFFCSCLVISEHWCEIRK